MSKLTQAKPGAVVQSWQAGQPPGAEGGGVCVPEYFLSQQSSTIHMLYSLIEQPSTTSILRFVYSMNIEDRQMSVPENFLIQPSTIHNHNPKSTTIHYSQSTIYVPHQISGLETLCHKI